LVDLYSVEQIAVAMRRVFQEPGLVEERCKRGLKRAAQFTWEETARQTIAVYQKVLGGELK